MLGRASAARRRTGRYRAPRRRRRHRARRSRSPSRSSAAPARERRSRPRCRSRRRWRRRSGCARRMIDGVLVGAELRHGGSAGSAGSALPSSRSSSGLRSSSASTKALSSRWLSCSSRIDCISCGVSVRLCDCRTSSRGDSAMSLALSSQRRGRRGAGADHAVFACEQCRARSVPRTVKRRVDRARAASTVRPRSCRPDRRGGLRGRR